MTPKAVPAAAPVNRDGDNPARAADPQGQAGGEDLAHHQHNHEPQDVVVGEHPVHHRVTDAVHLR